MKDQAERGSISEAIKHHPILAMLVTGMIFFILLINGSDVAGEYYYQSNEFEAKVENISYYATSGSLLFPGSTKVIVEFDNGVVVDVWEIPSSLRKGVVFKVDLRTPYFFLRDPYLVVTQQGKGK